MNLVRTWNKKDIKEFHKFLRSFGKGKEKGEWEQRIVNTSLPCIAVPAPKIKEISKEIFKGDYVSFLNEVDIKNHSELLVEANIICKIKDFSLMKSYLDKYLENVDNWSGIDSLGFQTKGNEKDFLNLAKQYVKSEKIFVRRAGVIILLKLLKQGFVKEGFEIIEKMKNEKEYYVNMAIAWYLCDCFIKDRVETLIFLKSNKVNEFVLNKTISKCRDSFRVSSEDKELLKKLKEEKSKQRLTKTFTKKQASSKFKENYFGFYDDVKSHTHNVYDW